MKTITLISFILQAVVLAACSKPGANSESPDSHGGGANSTVTVNGQEPETYFSAFLSGKQGSCNDDKSVYHFMDMNAKRIGTTSEGLDIVAEINIYMKPDHSYVANYGEHDVVGYTLNGFQYLVSRKKKISGTWKVVFGRLLLSGLGEGTSLLVNNEPTVDLRFDTDLITTGLNGKAGIVRKARASFDEDGQRVCE